MKPHALPPTTRREIFRLRDAGWSWQDIAGACGVTREQVRGALRKPRVGKKGPAYQLAEGAREMVEAGYPAADVRAVFGDVI